MTQLIKLTAKAKKAEIDGNKGKVIETLRKLGAEKEAVDLADVKKRIKIEPKIIRQHVRDLVEDGLASVKKVLAKSAA